MQIVCINNYGFPKELTVGETYDAEIRFFDKDKGIVDYLTDRVVYSLINNYGDRSIYGKELFKEVNPKVFEELNIGNISLFLNYTSPGRLLGSVKDNDTISIHHNKLEDGEDFGITELEELKERVDMILGYLYSIGFQKTKKMTKEEIEKELGYKIKIID